MNRARALALMWGHNKGADTLAVRLSARDRVIYLTLPYWDDLTRVRLLTSLLCFFCGFNRVYGMHLGISFGFEARKKLDGMTPGIGF